jgi:hypothetical protein
MIAGSSYALTGFSPRGSGEAGGLIDTLAGQWNLGKIVISLDP